MRDLIAAEWLKKRSLRSTRWSLGLTALAVWAAAAVAAGSRPPGSAFDLSDAFPLEGYLVLMAVATGSGAASMVGEYASGLIRATTVAVPARSPLLLAKGAVLIALWTGAGLVIALGSYAISRFPSPGSPTGTALALPAPTGTALTLPVPAGTALAAATLVAPVCALVGLALAVLLRHGGAAYVSGILLLVIAPQILTAGQDSTRGLNHAMIVPAWQRLTHSHGAPESVGSFYPTATAAWLVYALWPLVAVAAALLVHRRRAL